MVALNDGGSLMFSSNSIRSSGYYILFLSVAAGVLLIGDVARAALVHRYQGEGNAQDSAGSDDGTWNGNEAYDTGLSGQAFSFDGDKGADTGVHFSGPGIPTSGDWTIAFFMKSTSVSGLAVPVSQGHSNADGLAFQYGAWGQPVLTVSGFNDTPSRFNDTQQWEDYPDTDTDWHHVALTHDSGSLTNTMYLDGALANAQIYNGGHDPKTVDMPNSTWDAPFTNEGPSPLRFGDDVHNGNRNWNGVLDDVQIYDITASAIQISDLAANPGSVIPEPASFALSILGLLSVVTLFSRRRK